jgi:hypothetical protein
MNPKYYRRNPKIAATREETADIFHLKTFPAAGISEHE